MIITRDEVARQLNSALGVMIHFLLPAVAISALVVYSCTSASADCSPIIEPSAPVLEARLIILGELHGTRETPQLAGEYACVLAMRHGEVVLALEVPDSEQGRISAYLDSGGEPDDLSSLLEGPFWKGRDGRTSVAMADLVERVRELRRQRLEVSIIAVDGERPGLTRDAVMAEAVRDVMSDRRSVHVVALVGNVHGIKDRGAFFDPEYESFGYLLASLNPLTLNVQPREGNAWVCLTECGVHAITPSDWVLQHPPGLYLGESPIPQLPYHGTIVLPRAESSPPARTESQ